jgi:hypothetical protein
LYSKTWSSEVDHHQGRHLLADESTTNNTTNYTFIELPWSDEKDVNNSCLFFYFTQVLIKSIVYCQFTLNASRWVKRHMPCLNGKLYTCLKTCRDAFSVKDCYISIPFKQFLTWRVTRSDAFSVNGLLYYFVNFVLISNFV